MPLVERLTRAEAVSAGWIRVKGHLEARLANLRAQNDGDLPLEATAKIRGRIAEIRALLALDDEDSPAPETVPVMGTHDSP